MRETEQYARNRNIEIDGIEQKQGENLKVIMMNIAAKLNVEHTEEDVDVVHRVSSRGNRPAKIIAQFSSRSKREEWMAKKREIPIMAKDVYDTDSNARVYLNTHLCHQWKDLLWRAKQTGRPKGYNIIWYTNGKILAKKSTGDNNIIQIYGEEDFVKFI
jgi:hypothetical protein